MELGLAGMGVFRVKGRVRLGAGAFFLELLPSVGCGDLSGARLREFGEDSHGKGAGTDGVVQQIADALLPRRNIAGC